MTAARVRALLALLALLLALASVASATDAPAPAPGDASSSSSSSSSSSPGGGVTSEFARPDAHPAVDLNDPSVASPYARGADPNAPEQIHLAPRAPGVVTIVWASAAALDRDAVVRFVRVDVDADDDARDAALAAPAAHAAAITSSAYTAQICLGEPNDVDAVLGPKHPVRVEDLVALANTSSWTPRDAANYKVIRGPDDVVPPDWFKTPPYGKALCLSYNNPDAQYASPVIHVAHVGETARGGLVGGETVAYRLPGDKTPGGRTFQVPPAAVTAADVSRARDREDEAAAAAARGSGVVFGVVGDTGQTEVTRGVLKHLSEMKPHALLHTGDLSYADGFPPRWDTFGRLAEPLMSKVPMLVVAGNHDVTLNGVESTAFRARYPTPYLASGSASQDWFSHDVGIAHVIGLNSYAPVTPGRFDGSNAPMFEWLKGDLASIDRALTPWVIVMFHVPWYSSNAGHYKEALRAQEKLEPLLYDAGVDVVLNGHVHAYERSRPVRDWKEDACGAVHLTVGDGGNYEGPYGQSWSEPQPAWSAFREGSFGAGRLEILNATHASWEWRRTACVASDGVNELGETTYAPTGSGGRDCETEGDVSAQRLAAVDAATFVRDARACPNRAVGAGGGPRAWERANGAGRDDDDGSSDGVATVVVLLACALLGVGVALVLTRNALHRERAGKRKGGYARGRTHERLRDEDDDALDETADDDEEINA